MLTGPITKESCTAKQVGNEYNVKCTGWYPDPNTAGIPLSLTIGGVSCKVKISCLMPKDGNTMPNISEYHSFVHVEVLKTVRQIAHLCIN